MTKKELIKAKEKLVEKIKQSKDYFFIYGWSRQIQEIDKKLKQ